MIIARTWIDGPERAVRGVLLDGPGLAEWNPAFLSIGERERGGNFPIRVRGGLHGTFRYVQTDGPRLESAWHVRGLSETNYWSLLPESGGTSVEHGFEHQGPVGRLLRNAFATAGDLRLARLKARVEALPAS